MQSLIQGNDSSNWQREVDWRGVLAHVGFDIAKATEGYNFVDPNYRQTRDAARAVGTLFGAYHFAGAGNPIVEAAHFAANTGRREGELQVLDFEGAVLSLADPVGWAVLFLQEVNRRSSNMPLIYMSDSTLRAFDFARVRQLDVGLWLAYWSEHPPADAEEWAFWAIWQHADNAHINGVPGAIDADVFNGNRQQWLAYGHNRTAPAAPHPVPAPHVPAPHPYEQHPPAPTHRPAPAGSYRVKPGDTLDGIAEGHHTSRDVLIACNVGRFPTLHDNPHHIEAGWLLVLPGAASTHPVYVVQAGDTASGIAEDHGVSLEAILAVNPALRANRDLILAGQRIFLP